MPPADYLIMESTYGNRLHQPPGPVKQKLARLVKRVAAQLVRETRAAIAASIEEELNQQVRGAAARLKEIVASHETALARSNLVCALTAAIVVVASAIVVLSN